MSQHGTLQAREASAHHVLQRVGVGGHHTNGSGPLVVLLVEAFVEVWMVEQPEGRQGQMLMLVKWR